MTATQNAPLPVGFSVGVRPQPAVRVALHAAALIRVTEGSAKLATMIL